MSKQIQKTPSFLQTLNDMLFAMLQVFLRLSLVQKFISVLGHSDALEPEPVIIEKKKRKKKKREKKTGVVDLDSSMPTASIDSADELRVVDLTTHAQQTLSMPTASMDPADELRLVDLTANEQQSLLLDAMPKSSQLTLEIDLQADLLEDDDPPSTRTNPLSSLSNLSSDSFESIMSSSAISINSTSASSKQAQIGKRFGDCSQAFPCPLSYHLTPSLASPILKIATIMQNCGYRSFVFGGVVYRFHSLPSDADFVIPNFMTMEELATLEGEADAHLLQRMRVLIDALAAQDIHAIGFDTRLQIPGYKRANRYTLPLQLRAEDGSECDADLTLFAGSLAKHAREKDISISAVYYDPMLKKMYEYTPFRASVDLDLRIIKPIVDPVKLMRDDPALIFRYIRLHLAEKMQFDRTLLMAWAQLRQQQSNVFERLSDRRLNTELQQLSDMKNKDAQLSMFSQLELFDLLYQRVLQSPSTHMIRYADILKGWHQSQYPFHQQFLLYQQQAFVVLKFSEPPKGRGSSRLVYERRESRGYMPHYRAPKFVGRGRLFQAAPLTLAGGVSRPEREVVLTASISQTTSEDSLCDSSTSPNI